MSSDIKDIDYGKVTGTIIGLVVAVTLIGALLPQLGATWTEFIGNITADETFGGYVGLFSVVPIIIVVGILAIFIPKMKK